MRIIDVIDHTNVMDDEFVYREPQQGSGDWRFGSRVIVGESQVAVFVRGGEALDALPTGRHTLSVANLPILSGLIGLATNGRTPFTADLYFVNLKDMPQVGWGTNPPIPIETPGRGRGAALLSTHGTMNINVSDPMRFLKKFGIGKPITRLNDVKDAIQTKLLGDLTGLIMGAGVQSVPDANRFISELEGALLAKLSQQFEDEFGIRITAVDANPFRAKPASMEEIQDYVSVDMFKYLTQADIAKTAAGNEGAGGSLASAGVGLGVGQNIGGFFQSPEQQQMAQQQQMMQQMMMQKMMENMSGGGQGAANQQQTAAESSGAPQSRADVTAALEKLDLRLMNGEISESLYNTLKEKWEAKLDEFPE